MSPELRDALRMGAVWEKAAACGADTLRKKISADVYAFSVFLKDAALGGALTSGIRALAPTAAKGLAAGAGAALPIYAAGRGIASSAAARGHEVLRDARNQALLTGAGLTGMALAPRLVPQQRLAAHVMADELLQKAGAEYARLRVQNQVACCDYLRTLLP